MRDNAWQLRFDLVTAQALLWVALVGRDAEPTPQAHLYLFDRYRRLADHKRRLGRVEAARRLQAKADEHYRAAGGDDPPKAAAMAMPRPRSWTFTNAVSGSGRDSDDAA